MEKQLFYNECPLTFKVEEDNTHVVSGRFMTYDIASCDRGGYRCSFAPDCFESLTEFRKGMDIKALWDHEHNINGYLGRVDNGTLKLYSDGKGVNFEVILPNTQTGETVASLLKRGDLKGCSFGVTFGRDDYTVKNGDGETGVDDVDGIDDLPVQYIHSAKLIEVSLVFDPAFANTTARLAASDVLNGWAKDGDSWKKIEEEQLKVNEQNEQNDIKIRQRQVGLLKLKMKLMNMRRLGS